MRRPPPSILLVALLAALIAAGSPAVAVASRGDQIIRQCLRFDRVTGQYTQQDYRDALAHLPTDVREYSDCGDVIRRAALSAAGGGSPAGGPGAGATPTGAATAAGRSDPLASATPAERAAFQAAVNQARLTGGRPVRVGDAIVTPGLIAVRSGSLTHVLPTPLLVLLILLLVGALAALGGFLRQRVRPRRSP